MAKTTKANPYAEKYGAVVESLTRLDEIEERLTAIEAERREVGGRVPVVDAAPRFAETIRRMRESFEANLPMTRVFSEDGPKVHRDFGREDSHRQCRRTTAHTRTGGRVGRAALDRSGRQARGQPCRDFSASRLR